MAMCTMYQGDRTMSVNTRVSISMLDTCLHFSKINKNGISSFTEPNDTLDLYVDFLDRLSYDWINDENLWQLCINVFERKLTYLFS